MSPSRRVCLMLTLCFTNAEFRRMIRKHRENHRLLYWLSQRD
jgi:hypothetical protein